MLSLNNEKVFDDFDKVRFSEARCYKNFYKDYKYPCIEKNCAFILLTTSILV